MQGAKALPGCEALPIRHNGFTEELLQRYPVAARAQNDPLVTRRIRRRRDQSRGTSKPIEIRSGSFVIRGATTIAAGLLSVD